MDFLSAGIVKCLLTRVIALQVKSIQLELPPYTYTADVYSGSQNIGPWNVSFDRTNGTLDLLMNRVNCDQQGNWFMTIIDLDGKTHNQSFKVRIKSLYNTPIFLHLLVRPPTTNITSLTNCRILPCR